MKIRTSLIALALSTGIAFAGVAAAQDSTSAQGAPTTGDQSAAPMQDSSKPMAAPMAAPMAHPMMHHHMWRKHCVAHHNGKCTRWSHFRHRHPVRHAMATVKHAVDPDAPAPATK